MARSSASISLTTFLAACLAFASRLGATSVAAMLAELSIKSTNRWPWPAAPLHARARQGQHRQGHGQELKEQEQVAPQALKQTVDVQILQAPPPQDRARYPAPAAAAA